MFGFLRIRGHTVSDLCELITSIVDVLCGGVDVAANTITRHRMSSPIPAMLGEARLLLRRGGAPRGRDRPPEARVRARFVEFILLGKRPPSVHTHPANACETTNGVRC